MRPLLAIIRQARRVGQRVIYMKINQSIRRIFPDDPYKLVIQYELPGTVTHLQIK